MTATTIRVEWTLGESWVGISCLSLQNNFGGRSLHDVPVRPQRHHCGLEQKSGYDALFNCQWRSVWYDARMYFVGVAECIC